jgi:hypothetical protein
MSDREERISFVKRLRPDLDKLQCKEVDTAAAFSDENFLQPDRVTRVSRYVWQAAYRLYRISRAQIVDIDNFNLAMSAEGFYAGNYMTSERTCEEVDAKWKEWKAKAAE